jgi:two-component system sensor histidine kinase RegB
MQWLTPSRTGFRQAALYLLNMRLAIVAIQLVAMAVAEYMLTLSYQSAALILVIAYGIIATLGWFWFTRYPPRSSAMISLGLTLDLVLIGGWIFLTGGYTNPLISLLLLPIAMTIILVPLYQSIVITLIGVSIYTSLMIWHAPVTYDHHHTDLAQLHLFGMWITFVITAIIFLLVVGALARRLQRNQVQLAHIRENRLRDEQIITMGLSAASVAHRLGTPLNTLMLLVEEMKANDEAGKSVADDLALMQNQLELCNSHLHQLSAAAMHAKNAQLEVIPVSSWMMRLRESATLLWPAAPIEWVMPFPDQPVTVDATLDQAILNVLANALKASPMWVAVSVESTLDDGVEIIVKDRGEGMEKAFQESAGEQVVMSENGLGVGLFLSNATIQRLGGSLKAQTGQQGTTMVIALPRAGTTATETGGKR